MFFILINLDRKLVYGMVYHLNFNNCLDYYYILDMLMTNNEISPFVNEIKIF